jgi:hypothetical protein
VTEETFDDILQGSGVEPFRQGVGFSVVVRIRVITR